MNTIKVYTKDYCPYCDKAKNTLKAEGLSFEEIDITNKPDLYVELKNKTGHMTVPQIFVGDEFIGGSDDLEKKIEEVKKLAG
jgi:glutaredoxin 3